jgi:hypothetical protein
MSRSDAVAGGRVETVIQGSPLLGEDNEDNVRHVFAQVIELRGRSISFEKFWDNKRGEDGRVVLDGTPGKIQITTVTLDPRFCQEVSAGKVSRSTTLKAQAEAIRNAIQKKVKRYAGADRERMILLLDFRHLGLLASPPVLAALRDSYPELPIEGFREVWLIGPVPQACVCLPEASGESASTP